MPWTTHEVRIKADILELLEQLPEEAIIEYLVSLGYEVSK
jgi:hypothetical protein